MKQGSPVHAGKHLKGCMRILELRKSSIAFSEQSLPSPWEHMIAESVLFNCATTSLFDPDLASISVPKLRETLQPFLSRSSIPDCSPIANSPVLGISSEIFFIALEVSQLFYRIPLCPQDYVQALRLEDQLGELYVRCSGNADCVEEQYAVPKVHESAQIYIIAARILLFHLVRPSKLTLDPTLASHLTYVMDIIRDDTGETSCGQYFTWPVFIISCALEKDDHAGRELIRRAMENIWARTSSGNVMFVLQALDTLSEQIASGAELSTLDLLRCCV